MQEPEYLGEFLPQILSRPILPFRGAYTVTMREDQGTEDVLRALSSSLTGADRDLPRLHLGWGSFRNLDIVAARQSSFAIICDLNLRQIDIWSRFKAIIAVAQTTEQFVELFANTAPTQPKLRRHNESIAAWLGNELVRPHSWLGSTEAYMHVRKIVLENRFELLCCDLRDQLRHENKSLFQRLSDALLRMRQLRFCEPDTLYLSNIPWMMMNDRGFFGEPHSASEAANGFGLMIKNLTEIAPSFHHVVSAHRQTNASSPTNRQWQTNLYKPKVLLEQLYEDHREHASCDQTYRPGR